MAFKVASGYTNLPNGNFSPVIYSQKVQQAFRKSSVAESITNNDYFGEIANFGDTVRIIKEPEITVKAYSRGTTVTPQDLDDEDFTLTVDQANYFAFKMDDIEEAHSHVNFESMASDRAGYRLRDQYDQEVLGYLSGFKQSALNTVADTANDTVSGTKAVSTAGSNELLSSMTLKKGDFGNITTTSAGDHSIPLAVRMPGATAVATATATPLQVIARMARLLNVQQVDTAGRFLVVDPVFMELLSDEDSRLLNNDTADKGGLVNGISIGNLHGFDVYVSSNLPSVGTGSATSGSANQNTNFGVLVAGHSSAVATASQINKVESYRDPESFADIVRGMQMYGRKILRPEGIVTAKYNAA
jgi:hypothetical protein|tara:strand:+ start:3136 stop:4209 length:1074 start_codon:yes stop_codon:yes gene_type:complete